MRGFHWFLLYLWFHTGTALRLTSCTVRSPFNRCVPKAVSFAPDRVIDKSMLGLSRNGRIPEIVIPCTVVPLVPHGNCSEAHLLHHSIGVEQKCTFTIQFPTLIIHGTTSWTSKQLVHMGNANGFPPMDCMPFLAYRAQWYHPHSPSPDLQDRSQSFNPGPY